ncbi:helix-turn-helix domain-containing protein [Solilutibacter silvestris]|uniref:Helix-turn-helix protein n=1 Tax=Solilutibacter silvestris TaxID=1645665 RepID=A0A2K1PYL8_9GAMM|nr:helix-turn-helix domain-containing protein [Lysobacter silvestris]PNS07881.1 helix-turn-helix protein [Lysobacter silvestris]
MTATAEHGTLLRIARKAQGMTLEEAAQRTRIPARTLDALESGEWERAGAGVFVRGQLRSYGRLLGVDTSSWMEQAPAVEPPKLVSHQRTPMAQRFADEIGRKLVYVVITLTIAIPVWLMATRSPVTALPGETASLEMPKNAVPATTQPAASVQTAQAQPATQPQQAVAMASMAPVPGQAGVPATALSIRFDGQSWMQAYAPDGSVIEKGLVKGGESRSFASGQLGRITLGNASQVHVEHAGQAVDLAPYIRSDVARFAVSSDGTPGAVSN